MDGVAEFRSDRARGSYPATGRGSPTLREAVVSAGIVAACFDQLRYPRGVLRKCRGVRYSLYLLMAFHGCKLFNTGLYRPISSRILESIFYPVWGYRSLGRSKQPTPKSLQAWEGLLDRGGKVIRLFDVEGNQIYAYLIRGAEEKGHSGEVLLFSHSNRYVFDASMPDRFRHFADQGYSVLLYHPPGYGRSSGRRSPRTDFLAAEACMHYLIEEGYREEKISLLGSSIGSGAVSHLATLYKVNRLVLIVPFARLESVVQRCICYALGAGLGRLFSSTLTGVIRDNFCYDNDEKLAHTLASSVVIAEAERDALMTQGEGVPEARLLRGAVPEGVSCRVIRYPDKGHNDLFRLEVMEEALRQ